MLTGNVCQACATGILLHLMFNHKQSAVHDPMHDPGADPEGLSSAQPAARSCLAESVFWRTRRGCPPGWAWAGAAAGRRGGGRAVAAPQQAERRRPLRLRCLYHRFVRVSTRLAVVRPSRVSTGAASSPEHPRTSPASSHMHIQTLL